MHTKVRIEQQKQVADKVLDMLRFTDPTAIVAGGAPRDWYMGRAAKDIDVFMHTPPRWGHTGTKELLSDLFCVNVMPMERSEHTENYSQNPLIERVFDSKIDGEQVQFVCLNKPSFGIVDTFGFNVCKVWYKNSKLRTTKDFVHAVENQVLIETGELYLNSRLYRERIQNKFPTWKYFTSKEQYTNYLMHTA